jgi:hypothetical protein
MSALNSYYLIRVQASFLQLCGLHLVTVMPSRIKSPKPAGEKLAPLESTIVTQSRVRSKHQVGEQGPGSGKYHVGQVASIFGQQHGTPRPRTDYLQYIFPQFATMALGGRVFAARLI